MPVHILISPMGLEVIFSSSLSILSQVETLLAAIINEMYIPWKL